MCLQASISVISIPSEDEVNKRQVWIKSVNRKDPKNPKKKTGFPILTPEYVQIILLTVSLL